MSSTPNYPVHRDVALKRTKALPAANGTNAHDSIDLEQSAQYPTSQRLALEVALPATPVLVDTKKVTLTVKDSDDGVNFTAIPQLATVVATGAGGIGAAAQTVVFPLPGSTRRYLRLDQAVEAAGGDNTGVTVAIQLLIRL